ncbi:glycosyltransferase family 2 protein [soil metagenome]
MKISLITVSYNSSATIKDTIASVSSQSYKDIEYIIVDGNSKDTTVDVIRSAGPVVSRWVSEPDRGIYDAMNKGIGMATGEIVGIINSDDYYYSDKIISEVASAFQDQEVDAIFGDLIFVDPPNLKKVVRTYSSKKWRPEKFAWGYMPAHPTFFVRRKFYDKVGPFRTDYKIAADYEMLIRLLYVHKLRYKYLPMTMVVMRKGGVSSNGIGSNIILNREILRGCNENGISTNYFKIYSKYFFKLSELLN